MKRWQDWVNLVLGLWLVVSPWILAFSQNAAALWNALIVGAIFVVLSLLALSDAKPWEEWSELVVALWLLVSPWVLGYSALSAAMWNAVIVAVIVGVLAYTAASQQPTQAA
ncbi:SPW repeat protein [Oceanithermus sp.]|uniref:SPW repeat protein n=1 Tax=Oceanithermus sp. TaxID=2268145 RepID=UPI00257D102B|nr:SPW repeat protein [Oceanithermus sp.]